MATWQEDSSDASPSAPWHTSTCRQPERRANACAIRATVGWASSVSASKTTRGGTGPPHSHPERARRRRAPVRYHPLPPMHHYRDVRSDRRRGPRPSTLTCLCLHFRVGFRHSLAVHNSRLSAPTVVRKQVKEETLTCAGSSCSQPFFSSASCIYLRPRPPSRSLMGPLLRNAAERQLPACNSARVATGRRGGRWRLQSGPPRPAGRGGVSLFQRPTAPRGCP
jgi:hypothetical protein